MGFLRKIVVILLIIAVCGGALWYVFVGIKEARGNREWVEKLALTSTAAEDESGLVRISNVRDWTYQDGEIVSKDWLSEVTVDPEQLTRMWFVLEPFPGWDAAGHTYLTFDFEDGTVLSFSVEARREADEEYSAIKGVFRAYELAYTWGTERDFLARRLLFLQNEVRMYPLDVDTKTAREIFRALVRETAELSNTPRFYNTLTSNCTNILAETVNDLYPKSIPYGLAWNFPGLSDEFLIRQGFIKTVGDLAATQAAYSLDPHRDTINTISTADEKTLSTSIRSLLPE